MAITYNTLLEADFSGLESTGEAWTKLSATLEDNVGVLEALKQADSSKIGADNWEGVAAEQAREDLRGIVVDLDDRASSARKVGLAIGDAAEAFNTCKSDLDDVIAELDRERAYLSENGSVIPDTSRGTDNISYAENMTSRIQEILDAATEADEALKAAVGMFAETMSADERRELVARAEGPTDELRELIDNGSSPERINEWWEALDETEKLALLEADPRLIGDLDGIPTDFRDTANRDLLEEELDAYNTVDADIAFLQDQIAQMEADGSDVSGVGRYRGPTEEYQDLLDQLESRESDRDRRDSLEGLQDAITGQADTGQEYFLLGYDSAEDGKAIVSVGNPDTADNTAVYVPGTGSDLEGFDGAIGRAETMAIDGQEFAPGQETAVVAWLDYDAPNEPLPNAMSMGYAEEAGPVLSRFTEGLEATHTDGGAHTTVVGHSYGTTVVGHTAAEYGVEADKIIAVASPGMDTRNADELGVGAENVYATTAQGDAIRDTTDTYGWGEFVLDSMTGNEHPPDDQGDGNYAWHGSTNPVHERYGGNDFASDATDSAGNATDDGTKIHSGYWAEGNVARDNMAYIITDQTDRVSPAEG